ncbi:hypothetical protein [Bergeriella denitrificans]|uniref:DUF3108 domain-containing protein n=1 Tax=Bergeriella denitrificans TaxID=494 RepID=A0A378UEI6_BERDE|nr:hypothetical protein [Bergeriella denitrificans]STZ75725.1 Uncharacterised protein [Bergeriella denitrificans]
MRRLLAALCLLLPALAAAELPLSAELHYRSNLAVPAVMRFSQDGSRYQISTDIDALFFAVRFQTDGVIRNGQLYPQHYREIRNGQTYATARFDGADIRYGKPDNERSRRSTVETLDPLTLIWRFAAQSMPTAGFAVTNGRKIYPVPQLDAPAAANYRFNGRPLALSEYTVKQGSRSLAYGIAPALHRLPATITYTDTRGTSYRLSLDKALIDGVSVK